MQAEIAAQQEVDATHEQGAAHLDKSVRTHGLASSPKPHMLCSPHMFVSLAGSQTLYFLQHMSHVTQSMDETATARLLSRLDTVKYPAVRVVGRSLHMWHNTGADTAASWRCVCLCRAPCCFARELPAMTACFPSCRASWVSSRRTTWVRVALRRHRLARWTSPLAPPQAAATVVGSLSTWRCVHRRSDAPCCTCGTPCSKLCCALCGGGGSGGGGGVCSVCSVCVCVCVCVCQLAWLTCRLAAATRSGWGKPLVRTRC